MSPRRRPPVDDLDDVNLDPDDSSAPDPKAAARAEGERRFQRAKQWAQDQGLLRVEVESPSGRLVVYRSPAEYLEAFAAEEVDRVRRGKE